jgi:opacity protein-like surface antigen
MKKILVGALAVAATAVLADTAQAQLNATPFSVEVRAGAAIPTGDLADGTETGFALGGNVAYNVTPTIAVYGGYSYNRFGLEDADDLDLDGVHVIDRGWDLGLRVGVPTPMIPIDPWIKGGLVYHQLELDGDGGNISTDNELGFEVGAGLGFSFMPKVSFTPGVTYTSYTISGDDLDADEEGDVTHFKIDLGVRIRI